MFTDSTQLRGTHIALARRSSRLVFRHRQQQPQAISCLVEKCHVLFSSSYCSYCSLIYLCSRFSRCRLPARTHTDNRLNSCELRRRRRRCCLSYLVLSFIAFTARAPAPRRLSLTRPLSSIPFTHSPFLFPHVLVTVNPNILCTCNGVQRKTPLKRRT